MISQISESGGISPETRNEIETFLIEICRNISDFSQLDDYPQLAEFENETDCIEAVTSTLDRIPEADNSTGSTGLLRCHMLSDYIKVLLQVYTCFLGMSALSCLTGDG